MGKIKKILENELVGGTQSTDVYPVTSTKAVYDTDNKVLDNYIQHLKKTSTFAGIATPITNPGTPGGNVFYIAGEGTYVNFSNLVIGVGQLGILKWDGTWSKQVLEIGADIGLGFDGDGDRMGMVSENAKFLPTDQFMTIVVRDIINKVDKKEFLCDVKCSKTFEDEVKKLGGKCVTYRTGNSYTKAAVRDMDLPFGGELSGHVYFRDRWPGFDSGLYAGLRMLEILSNTDKTCEELLDGVNEYYSTEELKFKSSDNTKFQIVDKIKEYALNKNYKILDIDGVKVLFDDGWALVRASNTGPNITARFEANTTERLEQLQDEFVTLINKLNI